MRFFLLLLVLAFPPHIHAQYEDSRVSLLPQSLPALPGTSALQEARAQALLSFLKTHSRFATAGCDPTINLCLPEFSPSSALRALPTQASPVLAHPTAGPLLSPYIEANQGDTPTSGHIYIALAGDLIFAPFGGQVVLVEGVSAGRTRVTIQHPDAGQGLRLSIILGQFQTSLRKGDGVSTGQPIGRARPQRDASTRLIFQFARDSGPIDPAPWLQSR